MALESPLISSLPNMTSAFSPYTEFSLSPNSPAMPNTPRYQSMWSARNSTDATSLHPNSIDGGRFPGPHILSPSDMVGPSPVTSNGTESTEFEEEVGDEGMEEPHVSVKENESPLNPLNTSLPAHFRAKLEDEPASVIHAPQGYMNFNASKVTSLDPLPQAPSTGDRSTPTPYQQLNKQLRDKGSDLIVGDKARKGDETTIPSPIPPPHLETNIPPAVHGLSLETPRAQTRQEAEAENEKSRLRASTLSSLEGIPEDLRETDDHTEEGDFPTAHSPENDVVALKTALHECWTLCNTLANLSSNHRERIFSYAGTGDAHEKAWKCCWKLCQKLYDSRDDHQDLHVGPTLDLCRDFCQALFDVRQRNDELADSVLRVSFELNNHLFNTHDRHLPEAFRERTLDFYITLCHRLMKQRSDLAEETDSLLRACWSLAEMLFSLRQNQRDGRPADEELLGSAVQACWELCDLFREGWTQVRPERGTPRPSQTTFTQSPDQLSRSSKGNSSGLSSLSTLKERTEPRTVMVIPETPTTEFDDTPISPEDSPLIPNIMVLGTEGSRTNRWSSNSSNLSGYSQGSNHTSSTVKSATSGGQEDINLSRIKILILKAAMNMGFNRVLPSGANASQANALQAYVKTLPTGSFGSLQWHTGLLASYKDLVLSDPTFRSTITLPPPGKRASAYEVAASVSWMMRSGQYLWLKDLFRLVFGFHMEEAEKRKTVGIIV